DLETLEGGSLEDRDAIPGHPLADLRDAHVASGVEAGRQWSIGQGRHALGARLFGENSGRQGDRCKGNQRTHQRHAVSWWVAVDAAWFPRRQAVTAGSTS